MATERQRSANARNAKKSTGPKTASGKRRAAKNAFSHGLTTPPPWEDVLTYYRIVVEDADADPGKAATQAERAALVLAECEAACDRALRAETEAFELMAAYVETKGEPDLAKLLQVQKGFDYENPDVLRFMLAHGNLDEFDREAVRILYADSRHNLARRRRRLERISCYRQRAESRRRRAFKAWLAVTAENGKTKPTSR